MMNRWSNGRMLIDEGAERITSGMEHVLILHKKMVAEECWRVTTFHMLPTEAFVCAYYIILCNSIS